MKNRNTFLSLSKISYGYNLNPKWAADKWLSEPTTLEFIQLWERLHNLDFNSRKYIELCCNSLSIGAAPNVEELKKLCSIKGLFVDRQFDGDIYMHKDIAMDFAAWASPSFRAFCLMLMREDGFDTKFNFNSEEDFIISSKTLAEVTKRIAFQNFQNYQSEFVYNCNSV